MLLALDGHVRPAAVEEWQSEIKGAGIGTAQVVECRIAAIAKQGLGVGDTEGDRSRVAVRARGDCRIGHRSGRAIEARTDRAGADAQRRGIQKESAVGTAVNEGPRIRLAVERHSQVPVAVGGILAAFQGKSWLPIEA